MSTVGPKVEMKLSCFDCTHCETERYAVQGDSGNDVYCNHPECGLTMSQDRRYVADSNWATPQWCPLRQRAINEFVSQLDC